MHDVEDTMAHDDFLLSRPRPEDFREFLGGLDLVLVFLG
jgi:hypothetical protein